MSARTTASSGGWSGLRLLAPAFLLALFAALIAAGVASLPIVDDSPGGRLRRLAAEVDRVVVAPQNEDEARIELSTRAEIDEFLEALALEPEVQSPCKCDGNTDIDFYRGTTLRLALTFGHGKRLRCDPERAPRIWKWDAILAPAARGPFARRLADAGIVGPLDDLEDVARETAAAQRNSDQARLLPTTVRDAIAAGTDVYAIPVLFETAIPDPVERGVLLLRARHEALESQEDVTRRSVCDFALRRIQPESFLQVLRRALLDPSIAAAAKRLAVHRYHWGGEPVWEGRTSGLDEFLEAERKLAGDLIPLMRMQLTDGDADARRDCVVSLHYGYTSDGVPLLREVLDGRVRRSADGPPDDVVVMSGSLRARAAHALAWRHDRQSIPRLRELVATSSGRLKHAFEEALAQFDER